MRLAYRLLTILVLSLGLAIAQQPPIASALDPDQYEPDDTVDLATFLPASCQTHNFHNDADMDRYKIVANHTHPIPVHVTSNYPVGIVVYDQIGTEILNTSTNNCEYLKYAISFPANYKYSYCLKHFPEQKTASGFDYIIERSGEVVVPPVRFYGYLYMSGSSSQVPEASFTAIYETGDIHSTLSGYSGGYALEVTIGFDARFKFEADAYLPIIFDKETAGSEYIIYYIEPGTGNINGDDFTNLLDALIALKPLASNDTNPASIRTDYTDSVADASGNGQVGMEEVIFSLHRVAELR